MLTETQLRNLRSRLEDKRAELTASLQPGDRKSTRLPSNRSADDLAIDSADQLRRQAIHSHTHHLLEQVDDALKRLDAGKYGLCTRCGQSISPDRLEILPYAAECMQCTA